MAKPSQKVAPDIALGVLELVRRIGRLEDLIKDLYRGETWAKLEASKIAEGPR